MLKMLQACTITIVHVEELPTQIYSSCVEAVPSRLARISVVYERENVCVFLVLHAHSFWKGPHCSKLLQCRPFILEWKGSGSVLEGRLAHMMEEN